MSFPIPHLKKLHAALENKKLPDFDKPRIEKTIEEYHGFIKRLEQCYGGTNPKKVLNDLVRYMNEYKLYVKLDLVFDSKEDFLYRQKGQLKLDNSIIEEFLPRLIHPSVIPEIKGLDISAGPATTFSAVNFVSSLNNPQPGAGLHIRRDCFPICVTDLTSVVSSYETSQQERKSDGHIKSRHQTQGF